MIDVARAGRLVVVAATTLSISTGLACAQSLRPGDIVVVDCIDGNARALRIDPRTGQRSRATHPTTRGPPGTWPAGPRSRSVTGRDPGTLYVICQTQEFYPTDPFAATNGTNCYPFPCPKAPCGAVLAV